MKIKIQSVVDLITNSSTETFTILNGNAERIIRDIVDALLASAGSALTFSDLFVFDTKFSDKWEDAYYNYIRDFIKDGYDDYAKSLEKLYTDGWNAGDWCESKTKALEYIFSEMKRVAIENGALTYKEYCVQENEDAWDCSPALEELNIRVKDGIANKEADLAAKALNSLDNLYSADYRCG
jgi:hypothetical protein